jgi:hypothetical protein
LLCGFEGKEEIPSKPWMSFEKRPSNDQGVHDWEYACSLHVLHLCSFEIREEASDARVSAKAARRIGGDDTVEVSGVQHLRQRPISNSRQPKSLG